MCGVMPLDALLLPGERPTTFTTFHRIFAHNLPQITFRGVPTCIEDACNGRSLATTAGKLIGLVPRFAQVDDEIFVLAGQWPTGLGFDGLLQKACLVVGLSLPVDKPIAKCGICDRELGESNISTLY